jgi:hypothetical protein
METEMRMIGRIDVIRQDSPASPQTSVGDNDIRRADL